MFGILMRTNRAATVRLSELITCTDAFIRTMYAVRDDFKLRPSKEHIGTCINYSDLLEMREDFVRELKNTITAFVYSSDKQRELVDRFQREGRDPSSAWSELYHRSRKKFRPSSVQGQFSELLMANLLQHYFRAPPLLRKMSITTNPAVERHGLDAIHIGQQGSKYILYLGEAKTYSRETGSFRAALTDAVSDVITKHYPNHRSELSLYVYEDFLPRELEEIAAAYQSGTLTNVETQIVCMVTYNSRHEPKGGSRDERLRSVVEQLRSDAYEARNAPIFRNIDPDLLPRLNYIIFPVREMTQLIEAFRNAL